jgi:hypothetical protein
MRELLAVCLVRDTDNAPLGGPRVLSPEDARHPTQYPISIQRVPALIYGEERCKVVS